MTYTLGYHPASEVVTDQVSNSAYLFHGATGSPLAYGADGLDRYTTVGAAALSYDGRQNLYKFSSSGPTFSYDTENHLISTTTSPSLTLARDALGRIQTKTSSGAADTFLYAGAMLVGEYDASGNILARYVPGPGTDEAALWYSGPGTATPQWLHADPLGSTIAWSNATGGSLGSQAYDPFGLPQSWSGARFAYTGQLMLSEAALYDYKARAYSPSLGRFMQTDPAGYESDLNPYAYVGNDPVGLTDPSGMATPDEKPKVQQIDSTTLTGVDVPAPSTNDYSQAFIAYWNYVFLGTYYAPTVPGTQVAGFTVVGRRPRGHFSGAGAASALETLVCKAIGLLGNTGRLRLGGDAAGGVGSFGKTGAGISLRGDGSLEGDIYLGFGLGAGAYAGAGAGIDNAGGPQHGANLTGGLELSGVFGVPVYGPIGAGAYGSIPIKPSGNSSFKLNGPQGGGGLGVGPRYGLAAGVTATVVGTYRTPGICS